MPRESVADFKYHFIFKIVSGSRQNWVEGTDIAHAPHACMPPLLFASPIRIRLLLQLVNLQWHTGITQSPYFTLGFALGVECSMDLEKYTMVWIHHRCIIQRSFTALKLLCSACSSLLTPTLETTDLYCLHSFAFSRLACTWRPSLCTLLRLPYFTE